MTLVAGVDSSTQSVKIVVCDLETGHDRSQRTCLTPRRLLRCRRPPG